MGKTRARRAKLAILALLGAVAVTVLLLIMMPSKSDHTVSSLGYDLMRIKGTAQGGTLTIGHVGNPSVVAVKTLPGETSTEIMARLVSEINGKPSTAFGSATMTPDGQAMKLCNTYIGSLFVRTTDPGIQQMPRVSNLTAVPNASDGTVTLSWSVPDPAPDMIVVHRNNMCTATVPGTASSYVDRAFGQGHPPCDGAVEYDLVCTETEDGAPVRSSDVVTVMTTNPLLLSAD